MKFKDTFKNFFQIEHFKKLVIAAGIFLAVIFIFLAGIFVGVEKARFSYGWGEHYYENFVDRRGPPPPFTNPDRDYMNAHGVFGEIIKIEGNNIILKNPDDTEVTITTDSQTVVKSRNQDLKLSDIKAGDKIVVIGSPNDQGQIQAKFIRMPSGMFPY